MHRHRKQHFKPILEEVRPQFIGGSWRFFAPEHGFTSSWWSNPVARDSLEISYRVAGDERAEIARIRLIAPVNLASYRLPQSAPMRQLEVERIEVRRDLRSRRLGSDVMDLVCLRYPKYQFVAETNDAHSFWGHTLGWETVLPIEGARAGGGWRLYLQPADL